MLLRNVTGVLRAAVTHRDAPSRCAALRMTGVGSARRPWPEQLRFRWLSLDVT